MMMPGSGAGASGGGAEAADGQPCGYVVNLINFLILRPLITHAL
jgi:hypothetical protein